MRIGKPSELNIIGELRDKSLEQGYRRRAMSGRIKLMSYISVAGGLCFAATSFFNLDSMTKLDNIFFGLVSRLTVLLLAILFTIVCRMHGSYTLATVLLSVIELTASVTTIALVFEERPMDFVSLVFVSMACITVISALYGRWINMLLSSVIIFGATAFLTVFYIKPLSESHLRIGFTALTVILVFSSWGAYKRFIARRKQYLWETEQQRRAMTDALTGIGNRKKFDSDLNEALLLALRNVPFCIIMICLENDREDERSRGELDDRAIVAFTELISGNIRGYESFSRWNDRVFCLLAPHTTLSDATGLAQRLCRVAAMHDYKLPVKPYCCIGVVSNRSDDTLETMMERVARCAEQSARLGRNVLVTELELDE